MTFSQRWLWRMSSSGIWKPCSYLTVNTLRLRYRVQPVNAMQDLRRSRRWLWRFPSSEMLRRVALVRIDVPLRRRFLQETHGLTSSKMAFFLLSHCSKKRLRRTTAMTRTVGKYTEMRMDYSRMRISNIFSLPDL
jgi:hypothetical protein